MRNCFLKCFAVCPKTPLSLLGSAELHPFCTVMRPGAVGLSVCERRRGGRGGDCLCGLRRPHPGAGDPSFPPVSLSFELRAPGMSKPSWTEPHVEREDGEKETSWASLHWLHRPQVVWGSVSGGLFIFSQCLLCR